MGPVIMIKFQMADKHIKYIDIYTRGDLDKMRDG